MENDRYKDIDALLGNLFEHNSLKALFEKQLQELDISSTTALEILGISYRTLNGILEGTQKSVDYTNLNKLSVFLKLPKEQLIKLYLDSLEKNYPLTSVSSEKINFIKENFDLAALKKSGLINSITDFEQIEQRILLRLGLRTIFEYRKPPIDVAFSSSSFNPKNHLTRSFWIHAATTCFEEISNTNEYSREELIRQFPQIRWYSTNIEKGLLQVIKILYKLGVTVIYQPPLQGLKLRGATFAVNDKPCIVLTNYYGFYPTLWFALIHELYHVLFDFEEIKENRYHLTDDSNDQLSVLEREKLADDFAREYLFSREKLNAIRKYINDPSYVKTYALDNHVHPSIVYVFQAFDDGANDRRSWARAKKYCPDVKLSTNAIDIPWNDDKNIEDVFRTRRSTIYN
jgi:HTH-type transcriptional regulator / antitoxin HigA